MTAGMFGGFLDGVLIQYMLGDTGRGGQGLAVFQQLEAAL